MLKLKAAFKAVILAITNLTIVALCSQGCITTETSLILQIALSGAISLT